MTKTPVASTITVFFMHPKKKKKTEREIELFINLNAF